MLSQPQVTTSDHWDHVSIYNFVLSSFFQLSGVNGGKVAEKVVKQGQSQEFDLGCVFKIWEEVYLPMCISTDNQLNGFQIHNNY